MGNFIAHLLVYVKSLSDDVHLPQHLRKSSKIDFQFLVPRKLVRVWYHWKWFFKLYTLSYSDSSFIRWAQKSKKSRNSAYSCSMTQFVIYNCKNLTQALNSLWTRLEIKCYFMLQVIDNIQYETKYVEAWTFTKTI